MSLLQDKFNETTSEDLKQVKRKETKDFESTDRISNISKNTNITSTSVGTNNNLNNTNTTSTSVGTNNKEEVQHKNIPHNKNSKSWRSQEDLYHDAILIEFHRLLTLHLLYIFKDHPWSFPSPTHAQLHHYLQFKQLKQTMRLIYGISIVYGFVDMEFDREKLNQVLRKKLLKKLWRMKYRIADLNK